MMEEERAELTERWKNFVNVVVRHELAGICVGFRTDYGRYTVEQICCWLDIAVLDDVKEHLVFAMNVPFEWHFSGVNRWMNMKACVQRRFILR